MLIKHKSVNEQFYLVLQLLISEPLNATYHPYLVDNKTTVECSYFIQH